MPTNNWKEIPDGQVNVERAGAEGRSDVLGWATAVLGPRVPRVFEDFSDREGWGDPGKVPGLDAARAAAEEEVGQLGERRSKTSTSHSLKKERTTMPCLGKVNLAEFLGPNHPFSHSQISFVPKRKPDSKPPSSKPRAATPQSKKK